MPDEPEQTSPELVQDTETLGTTPATLRLEEAESRLREGAHDPSDPDAPKTKETPPETEAAPAKGSQEHAFAAMNREIQNQKGNVDRLIAENEALHLAQEELRNSGATIRQAPGMAQPQAVAALAERIAQATGDDPGQIAQALQAAIFEVVGPAANQLFGIVGEGQLQKDREQARKTDPDYGIWGATAEGLVRNLPGQIKLHPQAWAEAVRAAKGQHLDEIIEREVQRRMNPGRQVGTFRFSEGAAPGTAEPASELSEEQSGWIKREIRDPAQAARIAGRVEQIRQERESRSQPKRRGSGGGF